MQLSDKKTYFTPKWFVELLAGRLGFGDTFWAGGFGTLLFFVPLGFVLIMLTTIISPEQVVTTRIAMMSAYSIYLTLLLRVVLISGWRYKNGGAWRWLGMLYMLGLTFGNYYLVYSLIIGADV